MIKRCSGPEPLVWSWTVFVGIPVWSGPVLKKNPVLRFRFSKIPVLRSVSQKSELGPGTPLVGFSVKNYGGYANFQPQRSSERQLAISGPVLRFWHHSVSHGEPSWSGPEHGQKSSPVWVWNISLMTGELINDQGGLF